MLRVCVAHPHWRGLCGCHVTLRVCVAHPHWRGLCGCHVTALCVCPSVRHKSRPASPTVPSCHALPRSSGWVLCWRHEWLKLQESTFLNKLSRSVMVSASADITTHPNWKTPPLSRCVTLLSRSCHKRMAFFWVGCSTLSHHCLTAHR